MKVDLKAWCVQYIRSRDALERKLVSLDEKDEEIIATYKHRTVTFVAKPVLDENDAAIEGFVTLVCLQTQQNFNTLVSRFTDFAKNSNLTIIFLNPTLGEKWMLKPSVHAAVADKASLKAGLQSLYQMVPETR